MKKIILIGLIASMSSLNAQKSFEKKANVFCVGLDLGLYNYVSTIASTNSSKTSSAKNRSLSFVYERGVCNWLGIGAKFQMSNYFTEKDSATGEKPTVKAVDGTIIINTHFIKTRRFDFVAGFDVGYSSINWNAKDSFVSGANGGGLTYDFHIQPRFYFGNHFGMFVNLAYANYNYQNLDFKNTAVNLKDVLDLNGAGTNIGFGLQVKF